jgi:hypothetical protein
VVVCGYEGDIDRDCGRDSNVFGTPAISGIVARELGVSMRIKVWMIVVAAGVLCLVWTMLLLANRVDVYYGRYPTSADLEAINATHNHLRNVYLLEIGATLLAALAVGFWTARRPNA